MHLLLYNLTCFPDFKLLDFTLKEKFNSKHILSTNLNLLTGNIKLFHQSGYSCILNMLNRFLEV